MGHRRVRPGGKANPANPPESKANSRFEKASFCTILKTKTAVQKNFQPISTKVRGIAHLKDTVRRCPIIFICKMICLFLKDMFSADFAAVDSHKLVFESSVC